MQRWTLGTKTWGTCQQNSAAPTSSCCSLCARALYSTSCASHGFYLMAIKCYPHEAFKCSLPFVTILRLSRVSPQPEVTLMAEAQTQLLS